MRCPSQPTQGMSTVRVIMKGDEHPLDTVQGGPKGRHHGRDGGVDAGDAETDADHPQREGDGDGPLLGRVVDLDVRWGRVHGVTGRPLACSPSCCASGFSIRTTASMPTRRMPSVFSTAIFTGSFCVDLMKTPVSL